MEEGVSSWVVLGGWFWEEESYSAESTLWQGPAPFLAWWVFV